VEKLRRVLVPVMMANRPTVAPTPGMSGSAGPLQIPLEELAEFRIVKGPTAIKSEEGLLTAYVFIDYSGRDLGGYVEEARNKVASLKIPEGYRLSWSGEYEYLVRTHERLKIVIPLTIFVIFILIYFNTRSVIKTAIVLLAVPFSLGGSFWLLYILNYNMSIAVWVGIIALAGLDAETGVVMLLYLDLAYEKWKKEGGHGRARVSLSLHSPFLLILSLSFPLTCGLSTMATSSPASNFHSMRRKKSGLATWSASKTQTTSVGGMGRPSG
jgi:Cu(I)/Ag(I) efflux system membrane protein CusA/SilA